MSINTDKILMQKPSRGGKLTDKLTALRVLMKERGIDAYVILGVDAHNNDRMAKYWRARAWLSGFTGSAGLVVVTPTEAGLWTDGRYFIQAEQELNGTGIELYRMGEPQVPKYEDFLLSKLPNGGKLGFDGRTMSIAAFDILKEKMDFKNLTYCFQEDLVDMIWADRPAMPSASAFEHPLEFAGLSAAEKLRIVREKMAESNITAYLITALDSIAWLLNIRGNDIGDTRTIYAYALITEKDARIFIDDSKLTELSGKLDHQGFSVDSYDAILASLKSMPPTGKIYYDPAKTNIMLTSAIPQGIERPIKDKDKDIIVYLKGVKSEIELANIRNAFIKEGVAMTRLLKWIDEAVSVGKVFTEDDVSTAMTNFRKTGEHCIGDSFATIAAYGANAALPHYQHTDSGETVKHEGFLLIDTGGQYLDGTTDTTRTVVVGSISAEMKRDFTSVLKGHIALLSAVFPTGTTGHALDMLARQPILKGCKNYNHGTGHGIGYCLGVHEGPHGIAQQHSDVALVPGMIVSNEPGIYVKGRYGIRTENVIAVKELCKNEHGTFLNFENLTFCPYDIRAIDVTLLTQEEIDFVNMYHSKVYQVLSPMLTEDEQRWLKSKVVKLLK